jgi:hypothetical protein
VRYPEIQAPAPAHDAQGKPTYGLVRGLARLFIPGAGDGDRIRPLEAPADVEMSTPHLPGGLDRTEVRLLLWVSPEGTVQDCRAGKGKASSIWLPRCAPQRASWRRGSMWASKGPVWPL